MAELLFDTNLLINHLNGVKEATAWLKKVQDGAISGYLSPITEIEVFSGKDVENPRMMADAEELIKIFGRVELSPEITRVAGRLRQNTKIKLADSIIAATAVVTGYKLLTKNIADFKQIKEIMVEEPY